MIILKSILFISFEIIEILNQFDKHYTYYHIGSVLWYVLDIILNILIDVIILYTYIKGLYILSYDWYISHRDEFDKYGETEKMHELFIIISRCSVICILSVSINIIDVIFGAIEQYLIVPNATSTMTVFVNNIAAFLIALDCATYALAVYFVFDFGHEAYEKLCGCCDEGMRRCCKDRYMTIHNGNVYIRQIDSNAYDPNA